ncbi:MAG: YicC family protein [Deltaproteobacteria bacterium]|nr:YicC family protein [Deltaproteobacteria bacterium]
MKSMTGYGSGVGTFPGGRVSVDLRTVNHRFVEIKMPLPRELLSWESEFRTTIENQVKRGRVEMSLTTVGRPARTYTVQPNTDLARSYHKALKHLYQELNIKTEIDLSFLTARQDFFQVSEQAQAGADEIHAAKEALQEALTNLDRQRSREGKFLQRDLRARVVALEKTRRTIRERSHSAQDTSRQKLKDRVTSLLQGVEIDHNRLLQEIITLTQKSDITEEIVRLDSHIKALTDLLRAAEPVGKRIEFLLQETQREINTIGAKSDDVAIRHAVVGAKEEVEKMREQVQNVE